MHQIRHFTFAFLILTWFAACKPASNNPSPSGNANGVTPLAQVPTVQDMVMYEVNLRAFSQQGNLQGVTARLDSIKALGVNVIWLMPINPQGVLRSVGSPYAIRDYKAIGAEYGTMDDLKELINQAHQRGMAVIMDWVANHTSWDNEWINNPTWYTRVNGQIVQPPGTNWTDVADLDFASAPMRLAMVDAMKYWITEAGVDGYRCDAADMVPFSFWNQAIDSLRRIPNRQLIMLAEGIRQDHYAAGFQLAFSWDHFARLKDVFRGSGANVLHTTHLSEMNGVNLSQSRLRFSTNHDESAWDASPITMFNGKAGSFSAFAISAMSGGVPLIYSSQEVGRSTTVPFFSRSPINWNENLDLFAQYKGLMQVYRSHAKWRARPDLSIGTADVWGVRKRVGSDQGWVVANVRNQNRKVAISGGRNIVFSTGTVNWQGDSLQLAPYQVVVGE